MLNYENYDEQDIQDEQIRVNNNCAMICLYKLVALGVDSLDAIKECAEKFNVQESVVTHLYDY